MNNILDLVEKFNKVEEKSNEMCEVDKQFCENIHTQYQYALAYYNTIAKISAESENNQPYADLVSEYSDLNVGRNEFELGKRITEVHNSYIETIYNYFSKKYNVKINQRDGFRERDVEKDYRNAVPYVYNQIKLHFSEFYEDILKQLGGLSFEQTKLRQLKKQFFDLVAFKNGKGNLLKNNVVTLVRYLYWEKRWSDDLRLCYNSFEYIKTLESALSSFSNQDISGLGVFESNVDFDVIPNPVSIYPSDVVQNVKCFKNGKIEIKFANSQLAKEFAVEWCKFDLTEVENAG